MDKRFYTEKNVMGWARNRETHITAILSEHRESIKIRCRYIVDASALEYRIKTRSTPSLVGAYGVETPWRVCLDFDRQKVALLYEFGLNINI